MSNYSKEQVIELLKYYEKELNCDSWKFVMQEMNVKIKQLETEENPKIKKLTIKLNTYTTRYGANSKKVLRIRNKIDRQSNKLLYG